MKHPSVLLLAVVVFAAPAFAEMPGGYAYKPATVSLPTPLPPALPAPATLPSPEMPSPMNSPIASFPVAPPPSVPIDSPTPAGNVDTALMLANLFQSWSCSLDCTKMKTILPASPSAGTLSTSVANALCDAELSTEASAGAEVGSVNAPNGIVVCTASTCQTVTVLAATEQIAKARALEKGCTGGYQYAVLDSCQKQ